jgi:hypothetical protein
VRFPSLTEADRLSHSWGNLNAAGETKRVLTTSVGFVFACIGNVSIIPTASLTPADRPLQIVGPQVYLAHERPYYRTGLYVDIGCWACLCLMSLLMATHLHRLNKKQERRRIAAGFVGKSVDTSILTLADAAEAKKMRSDEKMGQSSVEEVKTEDTTDMENMFFHYVSAFTVALLACSTSADIAFCVGHLAGYLAIRLPKVYRIRDHPLKGDLAILSWK